LVLITLEVDSSYQVVKPANFQLQPYDQVVVRLVPEFAMSRSVEITGQVKYPGVYVMTSKETSFSEIIKKAGGLLPSADPNGSWIFRTYKNHGLITMNLNKALRHRWSQRANPILFEGDVININRRENTVSIREVGTRMAQYSTNPGNNGVKTIVFQGSKSARWYINHYAGGFIKEANKNSVTVTLGNDQMYATRTLLFFRNYPNVKPGAVITMQLKPPKITKEGDNTKMDWDNFWSRTLSATTALVALIVLSKQL